MSIVWDIWNTIYGIVTSADMITLGIGVVILLAAGFVMQGFDSLISTTIIAMIAFGLAGFVRAVTVGGQKAAEYATTDWHNFTTLNGLTLLAYALTFAVGIAVGASRRLAGDSRAGLPSARQAAVIPAAGECDPRREQLVLLDSGHAIGAIALQTDPVVTACGARASTRRMCGKPPSASQSTAACLRHRLQNGVGRAHVGNFARIERAGSGESGQLAVIRRKDRVRRRSGLRARDRARFGERDGLLLPGRQDQRQRYGAVRQRAALDRDLAIGDRATGVLLPAPAPSSANARGGAAIRPAGRRLQSRAPRASSGRRAVRHASFADTVEHEQRPIVRPGHQGLAGDLFAPISRNQRPQLGGLFRCSRREDRASPDAPGPAP